MPCAVCTHERGKIQESAERAKSAALAEAARLHRDPNVSRWGIQRAGEITREAGAKYNAAMKGLDLLGECWCAKIHSERTLQQAKDALHAAAEEYAKALSAVSRAQ